MFNFIIENLNAIFLGLTTFATISIAFIAYFQLNQISKQIEIQGDRERKWNTINTCEKFDTDPSISSHSEAIFTASNNGKDYTSLESVERNVICYLNYLESIAIGVSQKVYIEDIVYDHFHNIIYKSVKSLILGENGAIDGKDWVSGNPVVDKESYSSLCSIYEKWQKNDTKFKNT